MLDLGRYQAGPRCGLMFARMGAEVIKIEALEGDESRKNGPTVRGQSAYWVQYNSGKKSLSIDLRQEEGKEALRCNIQVSDGRNRSFKTRSDTWRYWIPTRSPSIDCKNARW